MIFVLLYAAALAPIPSGAQAIICEPLHIQIPKEEGQPKLRVHYPPNLLISRCKSRDGQKLTLARPPYGVTVDLGRYTSPASYPFVIRDESGREVTSAIHITRDAGKQ